MTIPLRYSNEVCRIALVDLDVLPGWIFSGVFHQDKPWMPTPGPTIKIAKLGPRCQPKTGGNSWDIAPRQRLLELVMVILAMLCIAGSAASEERLALLIGNQSYNSVAPLANAAADARLMADALAQEGFAVTLVVDANLVTLNRAIAKFGSDLRAAGVDATGLFFYAGHGVQSFGTNYLLPVDVVLTDAADLDLAAVPAASVLRQMASARNRRNIVILDACRDNPFTSIAELRDNGLAEMKAPTGTFLSYSTSPGAVALDGTDGNSPFTKALAGLIAKPGLPIEQLFREVRVDVLAKTGGKQTPWDTSSLTSEFFFRPANKLSPETLTEQQLWDSIRKTRDPVQIVLFIRGYKDSLHATEARALLIEVLKAGAVNPADTAPQTNADTFEPVKTESSEARLAREQDALSAAQESGRVEDYQAFLRDFSEGVYADAAKKEMAEIMASTTPDTQVGLSAKSDPVARGTEDGAGESAASPAPAGAEAIQIISFTTPLVTNDLELHGKSIAQLITGSPKFPPIADMPVEAWQSAKCSTCHEWTKQALCTQAGTYLANPASISRIAHPYGKTFKETLGQWSAQGCR